MSFSLLWPYLLALLVAAGLDIVANLFLARSKGFKHLGYGCSAILMILLAFSCLAYAVTVMDLAVAYALWGAFGILGTSLAAWALFGQKIRPVGWLGICTLIGGITLLHFSTY